MKQRIDVCHIFGYGPDKIGGIEGYIYELQKQLTEARKEALFIFTREPIEEFKEEFTKNGGNYIVIPHNKKVFSLIFLIKLLNKIKYYNPKILHSHFDSSNLHVAIVGKLIKIDKVYWHQRNLLGKKLNFLRNIVYRILSKQVTKIVAVSNSISQDLLTRGIHKDKITVIHNGINLLELKDDYYDLRSEFNIPKEDKVVITVAQARPEKDLKTLLNAASLLGKDIHFLIVGGGPLVDELESYKNEINAENIIFIKKRNDIQKIVSQSDIFVLTSLKEGLPNVILEASKNYTPVIATNIGGIPEIITHNKTGFLFEPGDYEKLAELIKRCLYENINEIVVDAKANVVTNFDLEKKVSFTVNNLYN